jgi:hypothetical protein
MTKPKYATPADRKAALAAKARKQMLAQWERQREQDGEELGYYGCHRRVRTVRGRAGDQACTRCGKPACHWAQIHGTDPADPQNYEAMCISCHRVYDQVRAQQVQTLGAEGRTAAAKLAWSRRTPEQRRAIGQKGRATRARNAAARDDPLAGMAPGD